MHRSAPITLALLSVLASMQIRAQSLATPPPPVRLPPPATIGSGPSLARPGAPPTATPGQLDVHRVPGTVPSSGPAADSTIVPMAPRIGPLDPRPPTVVRDAAGRPVPGALPAGRNQAYDPATGRYLPVTPAPPPPGR